MRQKQLSQGGGSHVFVNFGTVTASWLQSQPGVAVPKQQDQELRAIPEGAVPTKCNPTEPGHSRFGEVLQRAPLSARVTNQDEDPGTPVQEQLDMGWMHSYKVRINPESKEDKYS